MKKILRFNFIFTTVILCSSFLLCGIVEINDRTSYVISGQKSEVFRSQKTDGESMLSLKKDDPEKEEAITFMSVNLSSLEQVANVAKYCCIPPFGSIISFIEENSKK